MKTQKLTTRHLMAAFAVSHMSIHAWRRGSASRSPLPTVKTEGREVLFNKAEVKAWAKAEGVPFAQSLDAVLAEAAGGLAPVKPGPKAKLPAYKQPKPAAKPLTRDALPRPTRKAKSTGALLAGPRKAHIDRAVA